MTAPSRLPDPTTGGVWLRDRLLAFVRGAGGNSGAGLGLARLFRLDHLRPVSVTGTVIVTALDDGARFVTTGAGASFTLPGGLPTYWRAEVFNTATFTAGFNMQPVLDLRTVAPGLTPWAELVVIGIDAGTDTASQFAIKGIKAS